MLAHRFNDVTFSLEIRPVDMLLVKEGRHLEAGNKERRVFHGDVKRHPEKPRLREGKGFGDYDSPEYTFDMAFVHTKTADGDRFYLPGSSLRGVMRNAAERIVGRWKPDLVSEPFVSPPIKPTEHRVERSGGERLQAIKDKGNSPRIDGAFVYRTALPVERCFGHTGLRGRWVLDDAWMDETRVQNNEGRIVVRDGVGIDRTTGAAQDAVKFTFEALEGGAFTTTLRLVNYEHWQLGLAAHVLAALDGGAVRVGYGTRRGLGRVRVRVTRIDWRWYGHVPPSTNDNVRLPSLHDLAPPSYPLDAYHVYESSEPVVLPLTPTPTYFGSAGHIEPGIAAGGATDWQRTPWPTLGRLLAPALSRWQQGAA